MTSFADHPALQGLDSEKLAELALYGLRYRALGAVDIDFSKPDRLDVYWTGERMVKQAVDKVIKARKTNSPQYNDLHCEAVGHLKALFNCSVITSELWIEQWDRLLKAITTRVS